MKRRISPFYFLALLFWGWATAACGLPAVSPTPRGAGTAVTSGNITEAAPGKFRDQIPSSEPIDISSFTPAQQEGPYYPLDKPVDRDNDLVDVVGAASPAAGEILFVAGVIYGVAGLPVEEAMIEIWQADHSGIYQHPGDPDTGRRDPNFQFYGQSITGADGVYSFRTVMPGLYEPRPRHIHVKVWRHGQELLTTQFYFAGEVDLRGPEANLVIATAPAEDDAGDPIRVGERDIFLDVDQ